MKSPLRPTVAFGAWLVLLVFSVTSSKEAVGSYADFERWLAGAKTLQARFVQRLESGALGGEIEESGVVYVQRPGRMVWKYLDPEVKTASIQGGEVKMYIPEDLQMFISPVPEEGDLLPRLLLGEAPIEDLFRVASPEGAETIRLLPLSEQGSFESVELRIGGAGDLRDAIVIDSAGNTMRYSFEGWRRNRSLPKGIFEIETAPGTEILRPD